MNNFIILIIVTVIIICFFIYYESKYAELTLVKSTIDNRKYLCRNNPDKLEAANLFAKLRKRLVKIKYILKDKYKNEPRVKRFIKKYKPDNIRESLSTSNHTSYSVNKGDKLVFCIRNKTTNKLIDFNTIVFVAIHELAHIMTKSIGHTEEFWDNMRFILKIAIKNNLYKKQDFKNNPQPYCGITITDSPLED